MTVSFYAGVVRLASAPWLAKKKGTEMLEIVGLTYNDLPPVVPVAGTISGNGATIGRGKDNVIVLPDPKRVISRQHLEFVLGTEDVYWVRNIGSGNPVYVNDGVELAPGEGHPLENHDRILIGGYVLQVTYMGWRQENTPKAQPVAASVRGDVDGDSFLAELLGSAVADVKPADSEEKHSKVPDPFLYKGVTHEPNDVMQLLNERGVDPSSLDGKGDELINSKNVGMTMDELLADPLNTMANQPLPYDRSLDPLAMFGGAGDGGVFGDILHSGKTGVSNTPPGMNLTHGSELDALFHLPDAGKKPLSEPSATVPPPVEPQIPEIIGSSVENAANDTGLDDIDSFLAGLGNGSALTPKTAPSAADLPPVFLPDPDPVDSVLPPLAPDVLALPDVPDAPEVSVAPPAKPDVATSMPDNLYQAFVDGLGMELPGRGALDEAFMKTLGQALRNYTQGAVELISGRTVVKQAVRANVTVIAPERNNPLKFSPDANTALMSMFGGRPVPGFMGPAEAIQNAFVDLRAHQIGVISGMQAALSHVLDCFSPVTLGNKTLPQGLIENILPVVHKARLWSEYGRYFYALREQANDHFQEFFGKAFLEAYEKAIFTVQSGERASRP
jgi:predicted component of type VI protein secretion system